MFCTVPLRGLMTEMPWSVAAMMLPLSSTAMASTQLLARPPEVVKCSTRSSEMMRSPQPLPSAYFSTSSLDLCLLVFQALDPHFSLFTKEISKL